MPSLVWTDKATTEDRLGFEDYRRTIVRVIQGADTPITIGVFGHWGSGKTSLMLMVEKDLQAAGAQTIWFDAWKYDKENVLWRALLVQVLHTLRDALPATEPDARAQFQDLQASLYRDVDRDKLGGVEIDWGKLVKQTTKGAVKLSLSFIPGWDALDKLTEQLKGQTDEQVKSVFDAIQREKVRLHEDQAKSLEQFQDRFARAVETFLIKTRRRFAAIFIDDLDRCLPEKTIEVLEAVKLFLDVPGCVFILGTDRAVIEKGIELKYSGRAKALPISGDDYLEKIVQVPFNLPPLESADIQKFIAAEIRQTFPPTLAEVFAAGLEANPRKVKRTLNIFRLLWTLADERQEGGKKLAEEIQPELLAKIVVIQVRFRELYADVVEYPNLLGDLENHFEREAPPRSAPTRPSRESPEPMAEQAAVSVPAPETGTLVGRHAGASYAQALKALLQAGRLRFREVNPHPYIFLTRTATPEPEPEKPIAVDQRIWDDLLSNDATRIRAAIERIEPGERKAYVQRLLGILADYKTHRAPTRVSAGNALAYLGDPRDFAEMVEVNVTEFLYGDEKKKRPIKPFRIGKYPVTNAQYKRFVDATSREVPFVEEDWAKPYNWDQQTRAYPPDKANHPVVLVDWQDAQAYCQWAQKRLPTEEEWECAARGADGREYPWGSEFDQDRTNTSESGIGATSPVGVFPNGMSPCGALDMSGNVWEWTASDFNKDTKVVRGGSWFTLQINARCAYRFWFDPVIRIDYIGFRVAES
jgi:formylglycine-generating enzyme required for sulfatase activity